jgi:outer membrane protein assembly factor BamB
MRPRPFTALVIGMLVAGCGATGAGVPSPTVLVGTPNAARPTGQTPGRSSSADPSAAASARPVHTSDPTAAEDVPGYRGGSDRLGIMPGPGPVADPSIRWSFQASAPIGSQPAVAGGQVVLLVTDGTVISLDIATGVRRWAAHLGVDAHGSPAVSGDLLLVGADDGAHALAINTGEPRWAQPALGAVRGAPALSGDLAVFASAGGQAVGLDAATGKVRWNVPLGAPTDTSVAAADSTAVVGTTDGAAVALDASTGAVKWRAVVDAGARIGTPAIADGRVLLASLDEGAPDTRHVTALDLATGHVVWRFSSPGDRPSYTPAIAHGVAITEGETGVVTALDEASGTIRWQASEPGVLEIVPTLVGNAMYGAGNGTWAFALDAATGRELWRLPIKGVPYAPAITGGLELLPTNTGLLYAIGGVVP